MVNCCVPFCKSESGKKNELSVSFHDFPLASEALSVEWINRISRKDWVPSDTSKVCSLHFLPSDYRCGGKLKRLLPNAIPSVFPDSNGSFKLITKTATCHTSSILNENGDILPKEKSADGCQNEVKLTQDEKCNKNDDGLTSVKEEESKKSIKCKEQNLEVQSTKNEVNQTIFEERVKLVDHRILNVKNSKTKLLVVKVNPTIKCNKQYGLEMDAETKLGMEHIREINAYKAKLRRRDEKIRKLETEITALKKKIDASSLDDKFLTDLEKIFQSATSGDIKSLFILQQIKSFSHKAAHWDERILKELVLWRLISPKGYDRAKNSFLVLPHRTTLSAYIGTAKDVEFASLDKENFMKFLSPFSSMENSPTIDSSSFTMEGLSESTLESINTSTFIADGSFVNITEEEINANPLTDTGYSSAFEDIDKNHFVDLNEPPLTDMADANFEKLLKNKLNNKLEDILNETLENTSESAFDKLLENKLVKNNFVSTLEDSLENILQNTAETSLENPFESLLATPRAQFSVSCKRQKTS